MKNTSNYGFQLPEPTDVYNIENENENWSKTDAVLQSVSDQAASGAEEAALAHDLVEELAHEFAGSFVVSTNGVMGLTVTTSGLTANYSAGTAYVNGVRFEVEAGSVALMVVDVPIRGEADYQYIYLDSDGLVKNTLIPSVALTKCPLYTIGTDREGTYVGADWRRTSAESILERVKSVDGANCGLDADMLDGKHATDFAASIHSHSLIKAVDTRDVATSPSDYSAGLYAFLKNNSVLNGPDSSMFSHLLGFRASVDASGGSAHELAFTGNGGVYRRGSNAGSWANWLQILDNGNHNEMGDPHSQYIQKTGGSFTGDVTHRKKLTLESLLVSGGVPSSWRTAHNMTTYGTNQIDQQGALVIKTNIPFAAVMFSVKIEGYFYSDVTPFEITVAGYAYTSGAPRNCAYVTNGSYSFSKVRLARDLNTNTVNIILGDVTDVFNYPKVQVTKASIGYSGALESHLDGWWIMQEPDLSGYDLFVDAANKSKRVEASPVNGYINVDGAAVQVYKHPETHDASMIMENSTHRFTTDSEKSNWNGAKSRLDALYKKTAYTVSAAGWYRIATSDLNIGHNHGIFQVEWNASGNHGRATLSAGLFYANGVELNQLSCAGYGTGITKARVMCGVPYSGNYAFFEVYVPTACSLTISLLDATGWSNLHTQAYSVSGAVSPGYQASEIDIVQGGMTTSGVLQSHGKNVVLTDDPRLSNKSYTSTGYKTSDPGETINQWTKLATLSLTTLHSLSSMILSFASGNLGNGAKSTVGTLHVRLKQQAVLGEDPIIELNMLSASSQAPNLAGNFMAVTTQNTTSSTVVDLYYKCSEKYDILSFFPIHTNTNGTGNVECFDTQPFVATLPTGTQTKCTMAFVQPTDDRLQEMKRYRSGKIAPGRFTTEEMRRADGTLYQKSVLSNKNTNGQYTTRTINTYATDGATIVSTVIRTVTYDADGDWVSEE